MMIFLIIWSRTNNEEPKRTGCHILRRGGIQFFLYFDKDAIILFARMLSFYLQGCYHSICKDAIILFARMHENSMSLEKNMVY